jgi:hypothetical protein
VNNQEVVDFVHTACVIVRVQVLLFSAFLLPLSNSSVLIWNSFVDFKKSFEPCSGFPIHEFGGFSILMGFVLSNLVSQGNF